MPDEPAVTQSGQPQPRALRFRSQALDLAFVEWGDMDAPPLLLMHGARDHSRSWDQIATHLCRRWRVLAPDLRGHGDSQWATDGVYSMDHYIYDLAELIEQQTLAPVTIVAHSLGGRISLRYAGIYPENVAAMVVIEGLGPPPSELAVTAAQSPATRMRSWIETYRAQAAKPAYRYASVEEAVARAAQQNPTFPPETNRHLAVQGVRRQEDGGYSWKFDGRVRVPAPLEMTTGEMEALWLNIACPILLLHGSESFLPDPRLENRDRQFRDARIEIVKGAGHWSHHEQCESVMALIEGFLSQEPHRMRPTSERA